uniref:Palmitoyl-protein thioesterase 1 n=1 Tax=Syphacia muris TaxID=451379 RepID=A0A0N5AXD8_9BILA
MAALLHLITALAFLPFATPRISNFVRDLLAETEPTPIVIWHGMGDSCCNPHSMGKIVKILEESIPGVYVRSIKIGNNFLEDVESGYFGNIHHQIDEACKQINGDEKLKRGYHALGFSQGGQFLRGLAQKCPSPPIKNLVSMGGPQQGVYGLPQCPGEKSFCDIMRRLLDIGAYAKFVQEMSIQAQYWHDPYAEDTYRKNSIFLAEINNELKINETYRTNLLKLKNLVLIKFLEDAVVVPKESEWFGFYKEGDTSKIINMEESQLYKEDRIGLKQLNEKKRLHLLTYEGNHMAIKKSTFVNDIVNKYLK